MFMYIYMCVCVYIYIYVCVYQVKKFFIRFVKVARPTLQEIKTKNKQQSRE